MSPYCALSSAKQERQACQKATEVGGHTSTTACLRPLSCLTELAELRKRTVEMIDFRLARLAIRVRACRSHAIVTCGFSHTVSRSSRFLRRLPPSVWRRRRVIGLKADETETEDRSQAR
jgi:hypothetical protein